MNRSRTLVQRVIAVLAVTGCAALAPGAVVAPQQARAGSFNCNVNLQFIQYTYDFVFTGVEIAANDNCLGDANVGIDCQVAWLAMGVAYGTGDEDHGINGCLSTSNYEPAIVGTTVGGVNTSTLTVLTSGYTWDSGFGGCSIENPTVLRCTIQGSYQVEAFPEGATNGARTVFKTAPSVTGGGILTGTG